MGDTTHLHVVPISRMMNYTSTPHISSWRGPQLIKTRDSLTFTTDQCGPKRPVFLVSECLVIWENERRSDTSKASTNITTHTQNRFEPKIRILERYKTTQGMNCLCPLEHWARGFEFHSRHGCPFAFTQCVVSCLATG
jgi:hypothetical protein